MIKDVLDVDFAQKLLSEGWTIQAIALDFDFEYNAMKAFIRSHGLVKKSDRASPTKLLDYIELETLIERIQRGETSREIALSIGEGLKASTISDFVSNHGTSLTKVRADATELREAVEMKKRKRLEKQTRKRA